MNSWNDLKWWHSDECANVHQKLNWNQPGWGYLPAQKNVYRALHETPFPRVKCVIVGQDPYQTPGYATGLAFSVDPSVDRKKYPPSLVNIFQELVDDLHVPYPRSGDLTPWAKQGVLLWNASLTTKPYVAGAHHGMWDSLTKEVLSAVDQYHENVVFILWGKDAQSYLPLVLPSVENKRNHVVLSSHPSPLSARRGFFGSRPFSTTNHLLKTPIDWRL